MDDVTRKALDNAAASSAIEGLPLSESDFKIIEDIMEGRTTLRLFEAAEGRRPQRRCV